jgi:cell shape-determining protein MreC
VELILITLAFVVGLALQHTTISSFPKEYLNQYAKCAENLLLENARIVGYVGKKFKTKEAF